MTPENIQRVRASLAAIRPHAHAVGLAFYEQLFRLNPDSRRLFAVEIADQADKLMAMIGAIVEGLDEPDRLRETFRVMGERHAAYGVDEDHYDDVGAALLIALREALGAEFGPEVEEAWACVYADIAESMIAGAAGHRPSA